MAFAIPEPRQTENGGDDGTPERPLNILVIHEMLPHPDRHGRTCNGCRCCAMKKGDGTVADEITKLCRRAVPDIYWYHYFAALLRTWEAEAVHPTTESLRAAIDVDEAYI
jgi:hypothetical protein